MSYEISVHKSCSKSYKNVCVICKVAMKNVISDFKNVDQAQFNKEKETQFFFCHFHKYTRQ